MAQLYKMGRPPSQVMDWVRDEDKKRDKYAPCPCGSGKKFHFCHGKEPEKTFSGVDRLEVQNGEIPVKTLG